MTTLTHTLFGIVLAKASIDIGIVPQTSPIIYPLSIIGANLPDFDELYYIRRSQNHRESLLHTPLFWLCVIGILYGSSAFYHPALPYVHVLSISIVSHFIFDTIDMRSGIRWLYPFNKRFFNVLHAADNVNSKDIKKFIKLYATHPVAIIEGIVVFVIVLAFLKL